MENRKQKRKYTVEKGEARRDRKHTKERDSDGERERERRRE